MVLKQLLNRALKSAGGRGNPQQPLSRPSFGNQNQRRPLNLR